MEQYSAGTIEKAGVQYPIFVNDMGRWLAYPDGVDNRPISAESRENLERALTSALRKQRVAVEVPFTWAYATGITNGTVTGRHAGSGNLLVTWADGSKSQMGPYGDRGTLARPLDADGTAQWARLRQAKRSADDALNAFESAHRINLGRVVDAAIAAAVAAQQDAGE
jgi:hypothetical protein